VWLNPITASPDVDWGYDVSDYTSVHPALGTLETLDELVAAAVKRRLAIVLDIVPSHTSDQHPWFVDARSSRPLDVGTTTYGGRPVLVGRRRTIGPARSVGSRSREARRNGTKRNTFRLKAL
jgi:hypothetical protein